MPVYINKSTTPIYYRDTVFAPSKEVQTFDSLNNVAFIVSSIIETYNIITAVNDTLLIRFNEETAWTSIIFPNGALTSAQIAATINIAYGSNVASDEGGKIKIEAPVINNTLNAIYIATSAMGSTAVTTLGLPTDGADPVSLVSSQAFKLSQNAELYNITSANNTFIFKVNNNPNWITATLTIGVGRTAAEIVADINSAYEIATADANKLAFAVIPVTIGGNVHVKLLAPVYNNFQSKLYIKLTGNTALTVLGFAGNDFNPVSQSFYPSLVKLSELPLYNPIIGETTLTFGAASTQHYYLIDPVACKQLQVCRVAGGAGITFTIYLDDVSNLPPITLIVLETVNVNLQNIKISKIIITSNAAGSLVVRELRD